MAKLTPRAADYSKWYNELVIRAGLAENSGVRGSMVIKPYGFAIWEKMQQQLDKMFKDTGHVNAYFPLLIPKSYLSKEADHVKGFAKEVAVVTHYRLKVDEAGGDIKVDPTAKLAEALIIRPTSETIIWDTYKRWIKSYRDLPLLINQWANVVRWEMRTRLFLRTAEFLWQEGHTAHATEAEAVEEAKRMQDVYADFVENFMGIPIVKGVKTPSERFAGALETYTIEAMMQDGKALQVGTSHFLGQNFARAFDVKFANRNGAETYVWATSWGVSTRLMGALIMAHSDDSGLILPPNLAPIQVVIIPIYKGKAELGRVAEVARGLQQKLQNQNIRVRFDDRDTYKPGWKFNEYELKGVPLRLAIGPRDLESATVELTRRDTLKKQLVPVDKVGDRIPHLLRDIQNHIFNKALAFRNANVTQVQSYPEFKEVLARKGGFLSTLWDGSAETESDIQQETGATIRCIPLDAPEANGTDPYSGKPAKVRVLYAKAY
ncbi:MAG: proline--tRNA ligase [Flavobacteriales bacterium]